MVHALGWSADGSPGTGSLREFAVGAVMQHFPKTLNRIPGKDFRLPTNAELDALAAFQLSLGRQEEIDLAEMNFADPNVQAGKNLFNSNNNNNRCSFCHNNAGANVAEGFNDNFATNVARLPDAPARLMDPTIPGDGGFDKEPNFEVSGIAADFRGNGTMNVPPLVEAADSGPFFHNNSAATIEDAVHFYTTTTFSGPPPALPFDFSGAQINQVAAFLRALNALENIRSSNLYSEQAQREVQKLARQTVKLVVAETEDALQVLTDGPLDLSPDAVDLLEEALDLEMEADKTAAARQRNPLLQQAAALKNEARDLILE